MIHTKLYPWYLAQFRKIAVTNMTIGLLWSEAYWTTLSAVMWPEGKVK